MSHYSCIMLLDDPAHVRRQDMPSFTHACNNSTKTCTLSLQPAGMVQHIQVHVGTCMTYVKLIQSTCVWSWIPKNFACLGEWKYIWKLCTPTCTRRDVYYMTSSRLLSLRHLRIRHYSHCCHRHHRHCRCFQDHDTVTAPRLSMQQRHHSYLPT